MTNGNFVPAFNNNFSSIINSDRLFSVQPQQFLPFLLVFALFYPAPIFPDNHENLKLLRERIQALQKELNNKEAIRQGTSGALQETERAIGNITHKLNKLLEEDRQATENYKQLQSQYKLIKNDIDSEHHQLEKLLYQQYISGHQAYLKLALYQQNPHQLARNLYYYSRISQARSEIINNLQINQEKIETLIQISRQKKDEITAIQTEYFNQRKKLEQEKNKHQVLLAQLSNQISKQQQEINKLSDDEKRLSRLVKEINKLITQEQSGKTLTNSKLPDASTTNNVLFATLKGKLNLPVRGTIVNTFGSQRTNKHLTWKGLFIRSPDGSEVKAISKGKVVFADWLRGFGHLIILDHENGYMSLYGNNATLQKRIGDTIRGGDTIATVGNSGGNSDSGLYFELRHKGKPFDPLTWIKIE
ncbi:murein hydrolase activator EnvC family protein [Nitrosomonas sp.]|uniref:murein hydrolase activator EnvC family protein n=1 Tax=Nitrosomonas sp. TaxID=42353 RepID=UPI001D1F0675|nr:peptidoglycan DD-metalloendopeptidase family protein [Nitrosomonas sp.]MBX3617560.1 peptidoglycan DD-metalloendopeptidase family protein [Nitrosomonas sp.]